MTSRSISSAALARQLGDWREQAPRGGPAYRRLADGLQALVLDGRVAVDVRLPGERDLAAALGVSRTTVSAAYAALRDEGHLVSRHGSGSRTAVPGNGPPRAAGALIAVDDDGSIDLGAAAMPAAPGVHAAYRAALEQVPAHLATPGYATLGLPALRQEIADRYARRGLPTTPDQVLVTLGAQHAFSLVLQLLVGPGDRVVVDHPTYPHAIDAIARAAARPVPVGMTATGWDVEGVLAALRQTAPRLAYLLPDFHNPTGLVMPPEDRERIAAAAARARTTLVVDESLVDLGFDGPPAEPFAAHAPADDVVITLGSMSKGHWGGLRLGWIRAAVPTVAALAGVRSAVDLGTPIVEQLACTTLLRDDAEPLAERRALLAGQRDRLLAAVAAHLPAWR
ncbi:MocR-like transcription factor YczR, partial [Patulibacter sp. S7RM1-6]